MKRAVGVNGTLSGWKRRVEWVDKYRGRGCFDGKARRSHPSVLLWWRSLLGLDVFTSAGVMQCSAVYTVSPITPWRMTLTCVSGVWTGLVVSNAHTWVTWERERELVCEVTILCLVTVGSWMLMSNQYGDYQPLAIRVLYKLTHTNIRWFHFKIAQNRSTYKD